MLLHLPTAAMTLKGIANGIFRAASVAGKGVLDRAIKNKLEGTLANDSRSLLIGSTAFQEAYYGLNLSPEEADVLSDFLQSDEFSRIQSSLAIITCGETENGQRNFRELLLLELSNVLPQKLRSQLSVFASELIRFTVSATELAWIDATTRGLANSTSGAFGTVQALVLDEIINSEKRLENHVQSTDVWKTELAAFVYKYQSATLHRFDRLKPQSFPDINSAKLSELYVEARLLNPQGEEQRLRPDNIFDSYHRNVVLGNPGGGKSTFAHRVCYEVIRNSTSSESISDRPDIAIFVVLRDYGRRAATEPCSILDFIEQQCRAEFQFPAPKEAFSQLLLTGRCAVIFDGLDELLDIQDRVAVRDAVDFFALEYRIAPILITSRLVGYERVPMEQEAFGHYHLAPFSTEQVRLYANRWFLAVGSPDLSPSFLKDSQIVPDIRSNPLMLGLLCNLYKEERDLPNNRAETYQKCAELLFSKWDASRGIKHPLRFKKLLREALCHLAQWIYSDEQLHDGVSEPSLVQELGRYLGRGRKDGEALYIATEFVEFARDRAWVFSDIGADDRHPLYQFTHRTFLEFFAAENLVRNNPTVSTLGLIIFPRIKNREWDVVCQLACQLIVERSNCREELFSEILAQAASASTIEKLALLSFLCRSLNSLYPAPVIRLNVIATSIKCVFRELHLMIADESIALLISEIISGLFNAIPENEEDEKEQIIESIYVTVSSDENEIHNQCLALLVLEDLAAFVDPGIQGERRAQLLRRWRDCGKILAQRLAALRIELAAGDWRLALVSWWRGEVTSDQLVGWFGREILFCEVQHPIVNTRGPQIARYIATIALSPDSVVLPGLHLSERSVLEREATQVSRILTEPPLPWNGLLRNAALSRADEVWDALAEIRPFETPGDFLQLQTAILCLAVMTEIQDWFPKTKSDNKVAQSISELLLSKKDPSIRRAAHEFIDSLQSDGAEHKSNSMTLHNWIDARTSLFFARNVER